LFRKRWHDMATRTLAIKQSANVKEAVYDPDSQTLTVKLNGGTYSYSGVSEDKAVAFEQADSAGGFLHSQIKGQHEYSKVN